MFFPRTHLKFAKPKSGHAIFGTHTHVKVEVYEKYISLCTIHHIVHTPWQYLYGQLAPKLAFGEPADEGTGESLSSLWKEVFFCRIRI